MFLYINDTGYGYNKYYYYGCSSYIDFQMKLFCHNNDIFKFQQNIYFFGKKVNFKENINNISYDLVSKDFNDMLIEKVFYTSRILVFKFETEEEAFYFKLKYDAKILQKVYQHGN